MTMYDIGVSLAESAIQRTRHAPSRGRPMHLDGNPFRRHLFPERARIEKAVHGDAVSLRPVMLAE